VQPFASLPQFASEGVPRVLINKEIVGDFGSRPDDVVVLGDCDEGVRKLADALGWRDELESMWLEAGGKVKEKEAARLREQRQAMSKDELLEAEIEKLTGEVDAALKISKDHKERVNNHFEKSSSSEPSTSATPLSSGIADAPSPPASTRTKTETKDQPSSAPSTSASEVPTKIEAGWKEPPSTPATAENTQPPTERISKALPAEAPTVDSKAILDVTLPQNRPDVVTSELSSEQKKPPSRI